MKNLILTQASFFLFMAILFGLTYGQVPQLINYQGILIDPGTGDPIADGSYQIVFSIYDVSSGGSAIWSETKSVLTQDGLYQVLLGTTTSLTPAILSGPEKYLGIKVGADPEMTPRKRIVSVAYAILSEDANKLDGKAATEFADAIHAHDDRYYTETEMNTSDGDPPNQGSNRLSWDNLKNVPEGFADGVDNTGGGGGGWLDDGAVVRLETSADRVGIGTINPAEKLSVIGNILVKQSDIGTAGLKLSSASGIQNITGTNDLTLDYGGYLSFNNSGTEHVRITADGKVGIGLTNPTCKLAVADTIYSSSGGFKFPDGSVQISATGNAWRLTGNSGTVPGTHFLGTTDNQALELKVNNNRGLRLEPTAASPNLIGGYSGNSVTSGVTGAVIGGGGRSGSLNTVNGSYSMVGGGENNTASSDRAVVGGGTNNTAGGSFATIGGGFENQTYGPYNTISGGSNNKTSGSYATVVGGMDNAARGLYSLAAGIRAKANHQGCFVWNDDSGIAPGDSMASTAENQFIARAKGGVLFTGIFAQGTIPIEGAGTRMMWYPGKAAFRVGQLGDEGSHFWDDDSIGNYSIAMGYNTRASRGISTAMGSSTKASGYVSTAMGSNTKAIGDYSTAMGLSTKASEWASTAMGWQTTASEWASTAMGYLTTASGEASTAMGIGTSASGAYSTAMGVETTASGYVSTAMGHYAKANHEGCFVWSDNSGEEEDSLFSMAANQFLIRATGGVGIGTNDPQDQLHVQGKIRIPSDGGAINNTNGRSILETWWNSNFGDYTAMNSGYDWNEPDEPFSVVAGRYGIFFTKGDAQHTPYAIALMRITTNGDVGIGTTNPAGKLDVNGTIYQRGSLLHADYVFEPDYQLESIEDHATFMWQNKHLKAIPKATVDENGKEIIEVGSHRRGIVEELEKAHIYIEQLHKRLKSLEEKLAQMETASKTGQ